MNIDLKGKLAVVTGASGELGRVTARTLARCGADIAVHYFSNKAKADKVAADIAKLGQKAKTFKADVTDEKSVIALRDAVGKEMGEPQIIVNNAVIQGPWVPVVDGLGVFGPMDGSAFDSQGVFRITNLTMPNPALGVDVVIQAAYLDPGSPIGLTLTWALYPLHI